MKNFRLSDLIDTAALQAMADSLYQSTGMPIGIIDAIDGSILVGSGWQAICTKFHRVHPITLSRCQESDNFIKDRLKEGDVCKYKCKNGLWDIGIPIIVHGDHLATMFLGQFFYENEIPERKFFVDQGLKFGFDLDEYLKTLDQVPYFTYEKVESIIVYNNSLVSFITNLAENALFQKNAEKRLLEQSQIMQGILEHTHAMAVYLDRQFNFIWVNRAYAETCKHPQSYFPGKNHFDLYPHHENQAIFQRVVDMGEPFFVEAKPFEFPDQPERGLTYWDWSLIPVTDDAGTVIGLVFTLAEVTKRIVAENELRKSENRISSIFRSAPIGIGVVVDRVLTDVNSRLCDITGYDRGDLINQSARMLYPDDQEFEFVGREKYAQIADRGTGTVETHWRCKNGAIIDVLLSSTPIDLNDQSKGVTFTALEITERKKTENALRHSERRFRELAELLPETIYEMDLEGNLTFVNQNAFEKFGYTKEDLDHGLNAFHMIIDKDRAKAKENFKKIVHGESVGIQEYTAQRKDGTAFPALFHSSAIRISREVVGLRGFIIDITQEKQLQAQLEHSQKMKAIGTLAGGIAHEFNNMLSIIIGNAELAADDIPKWSPIADRLQEIQNASLRAKEVVRRLLSVARKSPSMKKPVEIRTLLEDALDLLRKTMPSTVSIQRNILCRAETILADPTEINQVIINLCTNALHAMHEETGVIQVCLEPVSSELLSSARFKKPKPGAYVKLTVTDTGQGIEPDLLGRVFDPYFTTKDVDKGLGMGLAVVDGIIKKHDGAIHIESDVGKGTTVEVLFPVVETQEKIDIDPQETLLAGTERILLIDDEPSVLTMVAQMIERHGFEVVKRSSSSEALELFRQQPDSFDLVITDMTLPVIPGDRLSQEILRIRPDVPIILCTGHSERIDDESAQELGIKAFVMKPFSRRHIVKTIQEVLNHHYRAPS